MVPLPGHRCQLTSERRCRRFASPALNAWLARLFEALPGATAAAGMPQVRGTPKRSVSIVERLCSQGAWLAAVFEALPSATTAAGNPQVST